MPEETSSTDRPADGASSTTSTPSLTLPLVALVMAALAAVPPYLDLFGELEVSSRVEFADHVVPAIVVAVVGVVGLLVLRSPEPSQMLLFVGGGFIMLAGFWMMATHFPLIKQGQDGISPWGTIAWHSLPGVAVTLFGLIWTARYWGDEEAGQAASPPPASPTSPS